MEKQRISLFALVLLAACGGKALDPPSDAGVDVKGDALECSSPADCLAPEGPCFVCPAGDVSCPVAQCSAGTCVVVHDDCLEPACPAQPSTGGAPCSSPLHCEYGSETCCGATHPSVVCDCLNGDFACYATDACMLPPDACSDGGPAPECTSDSDCAAPAICMTCPDGSCVSATAVCKDGACDVAYPPCP